MNMKIIETPWCKVGKFVVLGFGIPFSLVGSIWYFQDRSMVFLYNGILWGIIGLLLILKGKYNQYKFKRYKNDGICYDCTIIKVIPINMVRIGSYLTVRIECTCKLENSIVNVISGLYLLSPWDKIENLNAKIYMKNNKKYILVLFRNRDIFKV